MSLALPHMTPPAKLSADLIIAYFPMQTPSHTESLRDAVNGMHIDDAVTSRPRERVISRQEDDIFEGGGGELEGADGCAFEDDDDDDDDFGGVEGT